MPPLNPRVPPFSIQPNPKSSPTMSASSSAASWRTIGSDNPALTRSSMTTALSSGSLGSDQSGSVATSGCSTGPAQSSGHEADCSGVDTDVESQQGHNPSVADKRASSQDSAPATAHADRQLRRTETSLGPHNAAGESQKNGQGHVKAPYEGWRSSFPSSLSSRSSPDAVPGKPELDVAAPPPHMMRIWSTSKSADPRASSFGAQLAVPDERTTSKTDLPSATAPASAAIIKRARSPSMPILPGTSDIPYAETHGYWHLRAEQMLKSSRESPLSSSLNRLNLRTSHENDKGIVYPQPQQSPHSFSFFTDASPKYPASQLRPALTSSKSAHVLRKPSSVRFSDEQQSYGGSTDSQSETASSLGSHGVSHAKSVPNFADPLMYNGFGHYRNVMINALPSDMTDSMLRSYAEEYGPVHSVAIKQRDQGAGHPLYGFVLFKEHQDAQLFIDELRIRKISCDFAKEDWATEFKAREDKASANLYIVNLPLDMADEDLERLLHPARIISHKFLADSAGNRNGVAMARLESRYQADQAIYKLNGKVRFEGCGEALVVRIADSPDQKQLKRHSGQSVVSKPRSVETFDPWARRSSLGSSNFNPYLPSRAHADAVALQREYHLAQLARLEETALGSPRTPSHSVIFPRHAQGHAFSPGHGHGSAYSTGSPYSHRLQLYGHDELDEYATEERHETGPVSPTRASGWPSGLGLSTSGARAPPHQASTISMRPSMLGLSAHSPSTAAASLSHARSSPDLTAQPRLLFPPKAPKHTAFGF